MELSRVDYFVVQQVYRLGSLSFVPILAAMLLTLALVFLVRPWRSVFNLTLTALLCIAGAQAVFWLLTHPVNVATENWTVLPEAWEPLRAQWELSQAIVAILMLCAASALILSLIARTRRAH